MIVGTIIEPRGQNRDRVTTLHLFGDSDTGLVHAEMREQDRWVGYDDRGDLKLQTRLTAWRGQRDRPGCRNVPLKGDAK